LDDFEETFDPSSIVHRIRKIVKTLRKSPEERKKFADIVKSAPSASGRIASLILDVKTRWNSTFLMLKRAQDLRHSIEVYLLGNEKLRTECTINPAEWLALSEVIQLLQPMEEATRYMSKSKYPSVSSTLPIYSELIKVIFKFL